MRRRHPARGRLALALLALASQPLHERLDREDSLYGPTGGTLRYDAIACISFSNKRLGLLDRIDTMLVH